MLYGHLSSLELYSSLYILGAQQRFLCVSSLIVTGLLLHWVTPPRAAPGARWEQAVKHISLDTLRCLAAGPLV